MSGSVLIDVPVDSLLSAESFVSVRFRSGVRDDSGLRIVVAYVFEKLQRIVDCTGVPESLGLRNRVGVPFCSILRMPSREMSVSCESGVQ